MRLFFDPALKYLFVEKGRVYLKIVCQKYGKICTRFNEMKGTVYKSIQLVRD